MTIYYENTEREIFDMSDFPVAIEDITPLYGRKWKYDASDDKARNRSSIEQIYKTAESIKLTLSIFANSQEEYELCMNKLERITEKDIYAGKEGRLWVNGYYLECFVLSEDPKDYEEMFYAIQNEIEIVAPHMFWIKENEFKFETTDDTSTNNKKYPYKYNYRYANGQRYRSIINGNHVPSDFLLRVYGPVVNPQVNIAGCAHTLHSIIEEGEYVEINSEERTVIKKKTNGTEDNLFHFKGRTIFEKIPPGRCEVSFGKFNFELIVFEKKGTPPWKQKKS